MEGPKKHNTKFGIYTGDRNSDNDLVRHSSTAIDSFSVGESLPISFPALSGSEAPFMVRKRAVQEECIRCRTARRSPTVLQQP